MGHLYKAAVLFLIFPLLFLSNLQAAKKSNKTKSNTGITINAADKQEYSGDTFTVSGNVEVAWRDYRIFADQLEFNRKTGDLTATGRVTMSSNQTVITGERFLFNIKTRKGELYETYGQLSPTTRYTTDRLAQRDNETLTFKKLDFTPCAQCVPRWKITCGGGKIKKEKYIEMKHVVFKVKKIPVFYVPYMRYPVTEDGRATGFLMPRAGKSTIAGNYLMNGFFWNILPNLDLTLNVDYYSKAGLGLAQEFRYLTRKMKGSIQFYHFKYREGFSLTGQETDEETEAGEEPRKRDYFFKMTHQQDIPFFNTKTRLVVDIDRQSDPDFLKLLGAGIDTVVNGKYRSSVALTTSFSNIKFSVSAARNDTMDIIRNRMITRNYRPSVALNINQKKFSLLPGYFSLSAVYSDAERSYKYYEADAEEEPDISSGRIQVKPSYTMKLIQAPWVQSSLKLHSSFSFFTNSRDTEITKYQQMVDKPLKFAYHSADFTLKGPVFARVFQLPRGKLKHLIEPTIMFRYAVNVDKELTDRLLIIDSMDRPRKAYSYAGLTLGTRLLYKGTKGSAREIMKLSVRQDYYIDPAQANFYRTINDIYPDFSDMKFKLRLRPVKYIQLDGTLNYNHYIDHFSYFVVSMSVSGKKSPVTGSFKYIKKLNPYKYSAALTGTGDDDGAEDEEEELTADSGVITDLVGGALSIDIPGFPLSLDGRVDFDILNNRFRYGGAMLRYNYQCVTFSAGIKVFRLSNKNDTRFDVGISLGNLGMVRNMLGEK